MNSKNVFARWFGRTVLLGVAANLCLAIPALFYPNAVLSALGLTPDLEHPIWPSFASLLLLLLSAFYVPAAFDPQRYRASAYLSCIARWAGVTFFVLRPTEYPLFGYFDLTFALPSTVLLALYVRSKAETVSIPVHDDRRQHVNVAA
ncbi:MAG: hypothetical protein QM778_28740 [Myxococcales bacterium]